MSNRLTVALAVLLASGLALGGEYPRAVTFERWTDSKGELIKLESGNRSTRPYRITALTRIDPEKPGNAVQPVMDGWLFSSRKVRTLDIKKELTSKQERRVKINYGTTKVAYLRVDQKLAHDVGLDFIKLDGELLLRTGSIPLWGWLLTLGTISLASLMLDILSLFLNTDGTYSRTVPIPLDEKPHILEIQVGGTGCIVFNPWYAVYKLDTSQMQAGAIYWLDSEHWCGNDGPKMGVGGRVILKTNSLTVDYKRNGMPPLVELGQVGWIDDDDGIPVKTVQWANGHHSTLKGQPVPELYNPITRNVTRYLNAGGALLAHYQHGTEETMRGPITFRDILLRAVNKQDEAPVIPQVARFTVSTRHKLEGGGKRQQWYHFSDRQNRVNLWWCKSWHWSSRCTNYGGATFEVTRQANPQHLYLNPALDGDITKEEVQTKDREGREVMVTIYRAYPRPKSLGTVTVEETFRCISGACSGP